jgi:hypothetical protein
MGGSRRGDALAIALAPELSAVEPPISVIIPVRNDPSGLEHCLASLAQAE